MTRKYSPTFAIAAVSFALLDIRAVQAASQTLDKIRETGKITFGSSGGFHSVCLYRDGSEADRALARSLFDPSPRRSGPCCSDRSLGVEYVPVRMRPIAFRCFRTVRSTSSAAGTTNTAERQKQVSFSVATYVASPRWLVSAEPRR